ncbi:MFS general substrate transporter [Coprinellus micaceus]|uniref:MFS general substrate transporter n=1 Tax=Coprinellus micaceus TaxID=71717 RepID=A0A4Y7TYL1_COPMI|nr:MFS general substrate transporter [Coprinellus micaceus]
MPLGLEWRASYWFTTLVVGSGIAIDLLVYSIIIPVIPFQLEQLGYDGVSGLAGWLLFAYTSHIATFPIAVLSERYSSRRWPLILGFVMLIASQIMFMEAPNYAVMCIARVLQGISSSIVWVVGLALLCDCTPEKLIGQQLGLAMVGFSIGLVLGPPIGGALYERFGFRGPFVFGIIFSVADLIGRFVIIERAESIKWGVDPLVPNPPGGDAEKDAPPAEENTEEPKAKPLSFIAVMGKLIRSPRAVAAFLLTLLYGRVNFVQEPSIPVHLQTVWNLTSEKVGIVFIAAVVPTLFSGPLTGWIVDRWGTEWITPLCLILAVPWFVAMSIESKLGLFIAAFGLSSFFGSGVLPPLTAELAAVARGIEGVGYGHVYGAFNAAFGAGSTIGPVIGGQLYDHLENGWQAVVYLAAGMAALGALISIYSTGDDPLLKATWRRIRRRSSLASGSDATS